jgi:hypothetical protein
MTDRYSTVKFKTDRIVCLDSPRERLHQRENLHLFAEVIDTILISSRCWVRPLAIARSNPENFRLEFLHDLRDTAQLILPTDLFRDALDTEILPLISELFDPARDSTRSLNAQKALHQFIADLYRSD